MLCFVKRNAVPRLGVFAIAATALVILYVFMLSAFRGKLGAWSSAFPAAVLALGMLGLNRGFLRLEGWSFASIGLNHWRLRVALVGSVFGALVVGLWAAIFWNVAGANWRPVAMSSVDAIAASLIFLSLNNLAEELAYRSYAFLALERAAGANIAVLTTSMLFALLHIQGGVPLRSALAVVLPTALIYGAIFYRTHNALLVWMTHLAMNVTQEVIGLRRTALTFLAYEPARLPSASRSNLILIGIGVVTVTIACIIWFVPSRNASFVSRSKS